MPKRPPHLHGCTRTSSRPAPIMVGGSPTRFGPIPACANLPCMSLASSHQALAPSYPSSNYCTRPEDMPTPAYGATPAPTCPLALSHVLSSTTFDPYDLFARDFDRPAAAIVPCPSRPARTPSPLTARTQVVTSSHLHGLTIAHAWLPTCSSRPSPCTRHTLNDAMHRSHLQDTSVQRKLLAHVRTTPLPYS